MSIPFEFQNCIEDVSQFWIWLQNTGIRDSFRLLTVITSHKNIPNARTMVLREVIDKKLIFFTDRRSPKIQEIQSNPQTCIHTYDRSSKTQFLLKGILSPLYKHPKMEVWKEIAMRRYHDYGALLTPSSHIDIGEVIDFSEQEASKHFCVLVFSPQVIEILQLSQPTHIRFQWVLEHATGLWKQHQLVP